MKLLVLAPILPEEPSDGDKLRLFYFLQELSQRHELSLAAFCRPEEVSGFGALYDLCTGGVHTVSMPRWKQRLNALLFFWGDTPATVEAYRSGVMTALIKKLSAVQKFDAVLAYRLRMAPYALSSGFACKGLDFTDAMHQLFLRRTAAEKNRIKAWLWRREAKKLAVFEAECSVKFKASFINSAQDAQGLGKISGRAPLVVPNGVDAKWFVRPRVQRQSRRLVFVGNLAYAPNVQGLRWFCEDVLPLLTQLDSAVHLLVVGGHVPISLKRLSQKRAVCFEGYVKDPRALLCSAAVSICPVQVAAGRQNKIMEAFALKIPVVATSLTAQGVEARHKKELLVADSAQAFANACWLVMTNLRLAKSLSKTASTLIKKKYSWKKSAEIIEKALVLKKKDDIK